MSALDQAFIKAYGKPTARLVATQVSTAATAASSPVSLPRRAAAPAASPATAAIDNLYRDGGLYRFDQPAPTSAVAGSGGLRAVPTPHLPAPHLALPPPTSPRRGMRRSMLRLLASQPQEISVAEPVAPRIQRKVIIRHVAHSQQQAGLIPPPHIAVRDPQVAFDQVAELPPEFAFELPAEHAPPLVKPTLQPEPLSPEPQPADFAPLNYDLEFIAPEALVQSYWASDSDAVQAQVVWSELSEVSGPQSLVSIAVDAFPEPLDQPTPGFATKSLDDDRRTSVRVDPPHAKSARGPHIKFAPVQLTPEEAESLTADLPTIHEPLTATVDPDDAALEAAIEEPAAVEKTAAVDEHLPAATLAPVWEVDAFHWPRVCERLLADEQGYLAGAGEKLLAAVRDGLKTLAITGSRRGEGRTTLALCLARVAARAGIRVAVLDADFARPQIASRLGLEITHGWQDVAIGNLPLSEAAVKSLRDGVTVLPLEITAIRRSLSLADSRVTSVLRSAAAMFDLVIVDLGPLAAGEQVAFPPGENCPLDAVIVVRDLRFATAIESQAVGERLQDAGIEAVGIAENFVGEAV